MPIMKHDLPINISHCYLFLFFHREGGRSLHSPINHLTGRTSQ